MYWRDIPAQVVAKKGRKRAKQLLPDRFATAIDRAAMRAGRGSSDAYLADWKRISSQADGDLDELVTEQVRLLEAEFPPERLERIVKAGGHTEDAI
jgi:hypothetical protein